MTGRRRATGKPIAEITRVQRRAAFHQQRIARAVSARQALGPAMSQVLAELALLPDEAAERHAADLLTRLRGAAQRLAEENIKEAST